MGRIKELYRPLCFYDAIKTLSISIGTLLSELRPHGAPVRLAVSVLCHGCTAAVDEQQHGLKSAKVGSNRGWLLWWQRIGDRPPVGWKETKVINSFLIPYLNRNSVILHSQFSVSSSSPLEV